MNKKIIGTSLLSAWLAMPGSAATIQFDSGFVGGLSTNFANAAGTVTNGLEWGILVDTTGNGFLTSYNPITTTALTTGTELATDDLYFPGGLTYDSSQGGVFFEGDFLTPGGDGGLGSIIIPSYTNGAAAGQSFVIVWFDSGSGSAGTAGTFGDGIFVLPPVADTVDLSAPFVGVDPIRAATGTTLEAVPEPSAFLLSALGVLGLLRRKR